MKCPICKGDGKICIRKSNYQLVVGQPDAYYYFCSKCNGSGQVRIEPTHFIEVWHFVGDEYTFSDCVLKGKEIINKNLYITKSSSLLETIAIWKIQFKNIPLGTVDTSN